MAPSQIFCSRGTNQPGPLLVPEGTIILNAALGSRPGYWWGERQWLWVLWLIQKSATCDPTKILGTEWLGTTVVREYKVGRCKRGRKGEADWLVGWGDEQIWRAESGKEPADVHGQLVTQAQEYRGQILVQCPGAAGECLYWCLWFLLSLVDVQEPLV